ncbi:hypothetical protein ACRZ5O_22585 [Pseudomonas protegens]|uniref:hypothetical protein n=1 Tax=Pseudomonas protegens TaxID=380021 RepID=UPI003FD7A814
MSTQHNRIDTDYARALVDLLRPIHEGIRNAETSEQGAALSEAYLSIAQRLKELTAIQGGDK